MKNNLTFTILLLVLTTNLLCQTTSGVKNMTSNLTGKGEKDSLPIVEFDKVAKNYLNPVYYINGIHCHSSTLNNTNSRLIDSLRVEKKEIYINGTKRYGQIFIRMKKEYNPKLISLTGIKQKYAKEINLPAIFLIDNELVKNNYSDYFVDEKNIFKIIIDTIENSEDKLNILVFRLFSRFEVAQGENIKVRGLEE